MASTVIDKIRKLEEEKTRLLDEARAQSLAKANEAIAELNELGFHYRLTEGGAPARPPRQQTGRRSGIRDDVLSAVVNAGSDGISPSAVRASLGITDGDKSGAQSVSNALSALKRAGKIADKDGAYIAA